MQMATPQGKPWTPAQERMGSVVIRYMSRANKWLYRLTGGRLGSSFFGAPVMFLTTVGRKSGAARTVPLLCLAEGETLVTVASKGGMSHHPMWYRNLAANPAVEVEFQGRTRTMHAHTATADEKRAWWPKLVAMYPDYDAYQTRTERDIPVVVLTPRTG
jgi:deazaflavin-dependent oxidoreductase (nitroreductase family)